MFINIPSEGNLLKKDLMIESAEKSLAQLSIIGTGSLIHRNCSKNSLGQCKCLSRSKRKDEGGSRQNL